MKESKALTRSEEIREYLNIGEKAFKDLVKDGLPVIKRGNRWSGHKDEIDEYFRLRPTKFKKIKKD